MRPPRRDAAPVPPPLPRARAGREPELYAGAGWGGGVAGGHFDSHRERKRQAVGGHCWLLLLLLLLMMMIMLHIMLHTRIVAAAGEVL